MNDPKDKFTLPSIKFQITEPNDDIDNPYTKGVRIIPSADIFSKKKKKQSAVKQPEKVTKKVLLKRFLSPKNFRDTVDTLRPPKTTSPEKNMGQTFKIELKDKMNKTSFWTRF